MSLLGLDNYGSSDDEEHVTAVVAKGSDQAPTRPSQPEPADANVPNSRPSDAREADPRTKETPVSPDDQTSLPLQPSTEAEAEASADSGPLPPERPTAGPTPGPTAPTYAAQGPQPPLLSQEETRQIIQQLTLPPLPHVDIPPSPPGSPRPSATARIKQFLKLKEQGIHFNDKLASSSALRNPTLLQGQLEFAGMSGNDQYATTLPKGLKPVPENGFPYWAYGPELNRVQERLTKKKEREKGGKVEFINGKSSGTVKDERDSKRQRQR